MRFIHMTPFEANDKLILHVRPSNTKLPKFQVGDFVRVPEKRNIYSKGYTTNWNRELFLQPQQHVQGDRLEQHINLRVKK